MGKKKKRAFEHILINLTISARITYAFIAAHNENLNMDYIHFLTIWTITIPSAIFFDYVLEEGGILQGKKRSKRKRKIKKKKNKGKKRRIMKKDK